MNLGCSIQLRTVDFQNQPPTHSWAFGALNGLSWVWDHHWVHSSFSDARGFPLRQEQFEAAAHTCVSKAFSEQLGMHMCLWRRMAIAKPPARKLNIKYIQILCLTFIQLIKRTKGRCSISPSADQIRFAKNISLVSLKLGARLGVGSSLPKSAQRLV